MSELPSDIFTEPDFDPNTLANLGPLATMAGTFSGDEGRDVHPVESGSEESGFVEHYKLEPIDPQTNGPSSSMASDTTPGSSSLVRSRPFTTRSATGSMNQPPRRSC